MKKLYLLTFILAFNLNKAQGVFTNALYTFAGVTTSNGSTDITPPPTVAGITFGSFTAWNNGALSTANSGGSQRFSFSNQPSGATDAQNDYSTLTGSVNLGTYYDVTIAPNSGGQIDLTEIKFYARRSSTGVRTFVVRSSIDNYSANLTASTTSTLFNIQGGNTTTGNIFFCINDVNVTSNVELMTITLNSSFNDLTSPVTFRFYGYNCEGSTGTFSIDEVAFSGNVDVLSSETYNSIDGLMVYPNPTKEYLSIFSKLNAIALVEIYDLSGKKILKSQLLNNQLDVTQLAKGIYTLKIIEKDKSEIRKIVIE